MRFTAGISHVAFITQDIERLVDFYTDVFEAALVEVDDTPFGRVAILRVGEGIGLNLFEVPGNQHGAGLPEMFDRGHLDHFGLVAEGESSFYELRRRLLARGCTDGAITDFGPVIGFGFRDPDGMTVEVNLVLDPSLRGAHEPRPFNPPIPTKERST